MNACKAPLLRKGKSKVVEVLSLEEAEIVQEDCMPRFDFETCNGIMIGSCSMVDAAWPW
jgi:hypothetical protein